MTNFIEEELVEKGFSLISDSNTSSYETITITISDLSERLED